METVQTLVPPVHVEQGEVAEFFRGGRWVSSHLFQGPADMDERHQKMFFRDLEFLALEDSQESLPPWVAQRECLSSPLMDRPIWTRMTSAYGVRVHPVSGVRHIHTGIDFRGKSGTPVIASASGYVRSVQRKGAYGKTIVLAHENNYTTLYGHLSAYAIRAGQWVQQGQTLGYIGRTGTATGPHLHFEIRCHGIPLNPVNYLGQRNRIARVYFRKTWDPLSSRSRRNRVTLRKRPSFFTRGTQLKKLRAMSGQKGFQ